MPLHNMSFHSLFPHGVTCVLPTREEVEALQADLTAAGFGSSRTILLASQTGLDWLDFDGSRHGRWARFVRRLQRTCSEGEERLLQHLESALLAGRFVLIVLTHGRAEEREEVRRIAARYTQEPLYYCGTLAIEELPAAVPPRRKRRRRAETSPGDARP